MRTGFFPLHITCKDLPSQCLCCACCCGTCQFGALVVCGLAQTHALHGREYFKNVSEVFWAGVMLNRIFPDWTLTLLLVLLLGFLTTRVLRRGVRMWRAESADRARAQGPAAGAPAECNGAAAEVGKAQQPDALANGAGMLHAKEAGVAGAAGAGLGSELGSGVGSGRAPSALHAAGSAAALVAFWAGFAGAQAVKSLVERCSLAFAGISAAQARRPLRSSLLRSI